MTTPRKALPFTLLLVALWTLTSHQAQAQATDCSFTFTFTGNATQNGVPNKSGATPCVNWRITYSVSLPPDNLTATVAFQTSPDNITFTAVPNTICSASVQPPCILQGTNPLTGTTQGMSLFASYGTYVRVVVTGAGGTGTGTIRGYGAKGATASFSVQPAAGAGFGTVTNTGALVANSFVTGNGGVDIKTPCGAGCTLDASGNAHFDGTVSSGVVGGPGGVIDLIGLTSGDAKIQAAAAQGSPNPLQFPTATAAVGGLLQSNGANPQQTIWILSPLKRTICIAIGANNGSALADADLGPQSRQYFVPWNATLVEMEVAADAGTPNIIMGRSRAGSIVNVTSAALATAGSGGIACSSVAGGTGLDGTTSCSATLQNTGWLTGDWITLVSGTAGGTAKEMTACLTFSTLN